jgi:hypothetical protein
VKQFKYFLTYTIILLLNSCSLDNKTWEDIYSDQEILFSANRNTFELCLKNIKQTAVNDSIYRITDKSLDLSETLIISLRQIGISKIKVLNTIKCDSLELKFIPDSLWSVEKFLNVEITYDKSDKRNVKGFHWKFYASEHKHSFGQGNGWFIYSDSDLQ